MRLYRFFSVIGVMALAVPHGQATLIADWGISDSYVTSGQKFRSTSGTDIAFSDTVTLNPTNGYSGTSATFYGGFARATGFLSTGAGYQEVANSVSYAGGDDAITLRASAATAGMVDGVAVFVWNKSDFLGGFDSQAANLSLGGESLSVTFGMESGATAFTGSTAVARFVVKQGGSYYISDNASAAHTPGTQLTFSLDPTSTTWSSYAPAGTYTSMAYVADTSAVTLDDVQAVGVQFLLKNTEQTASTIGISAFSATAIPEPSVAMLIGLGGLLLLGVRTLRQVNTH